MTAAPSAQAAYSWLRDYPKAVDWHAALKPEPVWALFDRAAAQFADRPCINFLGTRYTYQQIDQLIRQVARGLQAEGMKAGDHVGLFLPNTPYFVIFYYAILKAGGVVVNFNPLYADDQVKHQIEDSRVRLMVTVDLKPLYEKLRPHVGKTGVFERLIVCPFAPLLPQPKRLLFKLFKHKQRAFPAAGKSVLLYDQLLQHGTNYRPVDVPPESTLAVLQYTGGTTGVPKGAMLSHANISVNAKQCRLWFIDCRDGRERMLGVLPLFHVFAMTGVMNLGLSIGAELILLPRFEIGQLVQTIEKEKPTIFPAVPTIYTAINNLKGIERRDLSSIRYCISGGAPLPVEVKARFEQLTGCVLVEGYGLTESSPVTHINPLTGGKTGTIGLPVPGTIVEIVSLDDQATVLPAGERGEVCLRGPQIMMGYWQKPAETAKVLAAGRLHTGDVGVMDENGYVQIVDRIKDMIIAGGYNIYPRNVEEAIYQHPAVAECVVAGVADQYRGQTVKAWLKLKDGQKLTEAELLEFLATRLSKIEQPKLVEFRSTPLPKTLIGKLDRKALLAEEAPQKN